MKAVRSHVETQAQSFGARPLFSYLRDSSIDPRRRLTFMPFLAHFVMTFSDLYDFVLPEKPARDRYQELVNIHVSEDVMHWKWFLADLTNADMDPTLRFTDALRFVWSGATVKTRRLSYEMCKLSANTSSLQKLTLVSCIEATGGVALSAVAVAGRELEAQIGRKLVYFGSHHVETESEHTLEDAAVRRSLDEIVVAEAERPRLRAIVDQAFGYFSDFVDEVFQLAQTGRTVAEYIEKPR